MKYNYKELNLNRKIWVNLTHWLPSNDPPVISGAYKNTSSKIKDIDKDGIIIPIWQIKVNFLKIWY